MNEKIGGIFANESTIVDEQLLGALGFIDFQHHSLQEVKNLSDLQSNHGRNTKNFQQVLRHCDALYSSTSRAQNVSKPYFASRIRDGFHFHYIYLQSELLYQQQRNRARRGLILEKTVIFTGVDTKALHGRNVI